MFTNMFTEMRIVSVFAMFSTVFFVVGAFVIMQYTIQQPSHWDKLPAYTNFRDTFLFIGIAMYAFEGQTMVKTLNSINYVIKSRFRFFANLRLILMVL